MSRFLKPAAVALAMGVLVSLPARSGFAQAALNPSPTTTIRDHQDIDDRIEWINHKDCVDDAVYTFTLGATGTFPQSANLHVWASTGSEQCQETDPRSGAGCKQVFEGDVYSTDSTQVIRATVRVRNILREGSGPVPATPPDETVCDQEIADKTDVVLQFFVLDSGGTLIPGIATYAVSYDLIGPDPPKSVKAGIGENALVVTWQATSNDELLGQYNVYVDAVGDADGGVDDGGTGAAGAPSSGCTSDRLTPGEIPTIGSNTQTNASTTEAEAGGLTNGVTYAVGVSAVDNFFNPGELSALDCATPEPVTGFFEAYRDAGGGGGGGYCSIGATRSGLAVVSVALAALGLMVRRGRTRVKGRRFP